MDCHSVSLRNNKWWRKKGEMDEIQKRTIINVVLQFLRKSILCVVWCTNNPTTFCSQQVYQGVMIVVLWWPTSGIKLTTITQIPREDIIYDKQSHEQKHNLKII